MIKLPENAIEDQVAKRIKRSYSLLKYAINNNLQIDPSVIKGINEIKFGYDNKQEWDAEKSARLDSYILELTKVTYPTTLYTLKYTLESPFGKYALPGVLVVTLLTVILAGASCYLMMATSPPGFWPMVLSMSLGMLGAELSLFFVFLGLAKELALSEGDVPKQIARIVLGAMVGYLSYVLFSMDSFGQLVESKTLGALTDTQKIYVSLPFLMGYSVRLVFGVLNKAIKSVELTLGLEDKSDELALRSKLK
ncbi:hypothetical protein [Solidesulfovibrio carbinolicus]|uniref:Uncharacterized protein n=1 Tax=Solidesulfovibrio carbinolicus TaxID=296842 RepID=A0A4P6HMK7_9BACT|nr:hypothetical protein [Solidesulfovibrio carbinolicus]QAZ68463.1 hypothetical protein C3Y92_15000 [Solidesulfovibrio carbinolicus]